MAITENKLKIQTNQNLIYTKNVINKDGLNRTQSSNQSKVRHSNSKGQDTLIYQQNLLSGYFSPQSHPESMFFKPKINVNNLINSIESGAGQKQKPVGLGTHVLNSAETPSSPKKQVFSSAKNSGYPVDTQQLFLASNNTMGTFPSPKEGNFQIDFSGTHTGNSNNRKSRNASDNDVVKNQQRTNETDRKDHQ